MSRQIFTLDTLDNKIATLSLTGTVTADSTQSGLTWLVSTNDTTTLNLPAAVVGLNYFVYLGIDLTNTLSIVLNGSDTWRARLFYTDKDTAGAASFNGASSTEGFIHYIGTADYVASSDARGRLEGTYLEIKCMTAGEWLMFGYVSGNGSVDSPFQ